MHSMTIRPKHGISVRSPQAPGPRSRTSCEARFAAGEGATTLGDDPFSLITCVRVSCASNAGKAWRSLFAPACRATDFHFENRGTGVTLVQTFFSTSAGGSQGISPFDFRHYRQTRFGNARSRRRRPQLKAHNSVRSLKNGLSLGGSSATRPRLLLRHAAAIAICFGLCASEEWGFAYILRSGSKLVSACNLMLPLVAAL